jgi:hypothetical protein
MEEGGVSGNPVGAEPGGEAGKCWPERIPPVTAELKPAFGIAEEAVLPVEQLVGEVRHGHEQQR